ncbi:tetratricopeptide repeat protein [Catenovulum sediminis]|uniref:tetratricopeptide repeat protein n=1 Tax=Catenovulum sediminis TaxID=1740262 RepID=UPI00117FA82E|nr:hypothetical protein [Catenovulum sediminis]
MLDAKEYLALAVDAVQKQEHHVALECLDKVLSLEPENALAIYLRAAEHVELGLFEKGIVGLNKALELDSEIVLARMQLAMLYMQLDLKDRALEQFLNISSGEDYPAELKKYACGFVSILEDNFPEGIEQLKAGVAMEQVYTALQTVIIAFIESQQKTDGIATVSQAENQANLDDNSVYLGAYRNTDDD